ncbi:MAG: gliding motility-associated C-terminal domain-containing protein [Bacteroidia bacterium]|nr:gliding motility-associated C-terminal domain-containing protein [Bacteroidia bacterium]
MIKRSTFLFGTLLAGAAFTAQAQEMFNNGGTVQINNIVVFVNGGVENNTAGTIVNDGNFWSTNNGIAPGSLTMNGGSSTSGAGKYYVEQDFVSNATFNPAGSEVIMNSNTANQNITGTSPLVFEHLTIATSTAGYPNPTVFCQGNVLITDSLWLNNRELATQTNVIRVTATSNLAITNNPTQGSEGFVSSLAPGFLEWNTASTSPYLFPVGSSLNTLRYRPIEITPNAATAESYTVRFVNNDATADTYDRNIKDTTFCFSNPNWYHAINRSIGTATADVKVHYVASADGAWDGLAEWQTPANQWNNIAPTTAGTSSYFATQVKPTWAFANPGQPYILIENRPTTPSVTCPNAVCSNQPAASLTATGSNGTNYTWTVSGGTTITSGQGTNTINVDLGSTAPIIVVATNAAGTCSSSTAACTNIIINQAPLPGFTSTVNANNELNWQFQDTTTGAVTSVWSIGGTGYTGANPQNTFGGPGTYPVTLTVTNAAGCTETVNGTIVVDYTEILIIPNVITPNGDGTNDLFYITHNGFKDFKITIFNRWGQIVYSAEAPSFHWDGKDPDGDIVSDGTYYYMLKGTSLANKPVEKEGYLMVYKSGN